jgi:hypothetical protein
VTSLHYHQRSPGPEPEPKPKPDGELPTSDLLVQIVERHAGDEVAIGDLIDALGERAFGMILVILTLPAAVPGPPGLPTIFAVPILSVAAQLVLGRKRPWLPGFVRRRKVSHQLLLSIVRRVRPALKRLEDICRPRLMPLTGARGERFLGGFIFLCALVLLNPIPIPFSHIPLAVALVVVSLGYVERDGYIVIAGGIGALFGIIFNISLMGGVLVLAKKFLDLF